MKVLGLIPARGGSKGVPRKNLRPVAGEPLLAYAVRAALDSRRLTAVVTSTDDPEIAALAGELGSRVLLRPAELAADDTPMVPVALHALEHEERELGEPFDALVLLQPTSPIRTGADVDAVIEILAGEPRVDTVISVSAMDDVHPARMYRLGEDGVLEPLWSEWETAQRQDLPVVYYRNGALYAVRRRALIDHRSLMAGRKRAYVMPREQLVNVDDERDLLIADLLVGRWKAGRP